MLCGLPIVAAGSCGGVDLWLDPAWSRVVPPEETAVAAAVAELKSLRLDGAWIRAGALAIMAEHRRRLCELGQAVMEEAGVGEDFGRFFYNRFTHKLATWQNASQVMQMWEAVAAEQSI